MLKPAHFQPGENVSSGLLVLNNLYELGAAYLQVFLL